MDTRTALGIFRDIQRNLDYALQALAESGADRNVQEGLWQLGFVQEDLAKLDRHIPDAS